MRVIAVLEGKTSNDNQVIAVSTELKKQLNVELVVLNVKHEKRSNFPNFLHTLSLFNFNKQQKGALEKVCKQGDIVVTCGRRSAMLNLHAKKQLKTLAVQILNPDVSLRKFDVVLMPSHDIVSDAYKNVIRYHGSFCVLNKKLLAEEVNLSEVREISGNERLVKKKYLTVFVGGSSKNFKFTNELQAKFLENVRDLGKVLNANILLSTSRRTPSGFSKMASEVLSEMPFYLYDWFLHNGLEPEGGKKYNPYKSFLYMADYFFCTADSISMCSEVCSIQKDVFIFTEGINAPKYKRFVRSLLESGAALDVKSALCNGHSAVKVCADAAKELAKESVEGESTKASDTNLSISHDFSSQVEYVCREVCKRLSGR